MWVSFIFIFHFLLFSLFIFRLVLSAFSAGCCCCCFCAAPESGALTRFAQLHFMGIPFGATLWHSAPIPPSFSPCVVVLRLLGIFYAYFAGRTRQGSAEKTLCKFLIKAKVSKRHVRECRERGREKWEMGDTRTDRQADSECRIGGAVRLRGVFRWCCCSLANCCSLSFNSFRVSFFFILPSSSGFPDNLAIFGWMLVCFIAC